MFISCIKTEDNLARSQSLVEITEEELDQMFYYPHMDKMPTGSIPSGYGIVIPQVSSGKTIVDMITIDDDKNQYDVNYFLEINFESTLHNDWSFKGPVDNWILDEFLDRQYVEDSDDDKELEEAEEALFQNQFMLQKSTRVGHQKRQSLSPNTREKFNLNFSLKEYEEGMERVKEKGTNSMLASFDQWKDTKIRDALLSS